MYQHKQAFTLIELLVVVLIIGILAAIAVPQYQKATDKARLTQIRPFVHAIIQAQHVYYLATGTYASDFTKLDIDVTKGPCSVKGLPTYLSCKGVFLFHRQTDAQAAGAAVVVRYCPTLSDPAYDTCNENKILEAVYRLPHATGASGQKNNTWVCNAYSARGTSLVSVFCP